MRSISDCNVAVVGGAGFLGSHVVQHLVEDRGCKVLVIDNLVVGRREWVHHDAEFVYADIMSSETHLRWLFEVNKIRFVLNYAAYPYILDSFVRPLHVCDVNFAGACKVINAAQEAGCEGILQVSSAEIYGGNIPDWVDKDVKSLGDKIDENAVAVPHSTYGVSKAAVDAFVQVRWREAKTPCIALRQFNCVGERESHPYVVPEIISQVSAIKARKPGGAGMHESRAVKLGNNSFRDFLYAGDQARMAVELLEKGAWGEVYNLGSESGSKVYDLVPMVGRSMGVTGLTVEQDQSRVRPWEIWFLKSCNDKINAIIDARPTVTLEEGVKRAVAWFVANGSRWPWEKQA